MRKINVVIFGELPGGVHPYEDDKLHIAFHGANPRGPLPQMTGALWLLVDWMPAALSGLELCRRLRCNPATAGGLITMVLDEEDPVARRRALATGADEVVLGPIDRAMLIDRLLAPAAPELGDDPSGRVQLDDLIVDVSAFQARWRDKPIPLMPIQLRLLRFFMEHPEQIYTRAQLIAALGNDMGPLEERTVDVWIGRLRRALRAAGAGDPLRTVRSLGYTFEMRRRSPRRSKAA